MSRAFLAFLHAAAIGCVTLATACAYVPPSRRAGVRRDAYLLAHAELRPAIGEAIAKGHVIGGMDREHVTVVLGEPVRKTTFRRDGGIAEMWLYPAERLHQSQLHGDRATLFRLVLVNGIVVDVEPLS